MQTQRQTPNLSGGLLAGLTVLLMFGLFIGLPAVGWFVLIASFVGLWVATSKQRAAEKVERETHPEDPNARPWDKV